MKAIGVCTEYCRMGVYKKAFQRKLRAQYNFDRWKKACQAGKQLKDIEVGMNVSGH